MKKLLKLEIRLSLNRIVHTGLPRMINLPTENKFLDPSDKGQYSSVANQYWRSLQISMPIVAVGELKKYV